MSVLMLRANPNMTKSQKRERSEEAVREIDDQHLDHLIETRLWSTMMSQPSNQRSKSGDEAIVDRPRRALLLNDVVGTLAPHLDDHYRHPSILPMRAHYSLGILIGERRNMNFGGVQQTVTNPHPTGQKTKKVGQELTLSVHTIQEDW